MVFAFPLLDVAKEVTVHMAPGMPPGYWWVTASVLGILALSATIDAFTEVIPDLLILLGLIAVVATQGMFVSWRMACVHFEHALLAGLIIWGVNFLWYQKFRYDALGMGDAKWTMLAVACFGAYPVLAAWAIGSILATAVILASKLTSYRITQVTFAPYLFVGLVLGLYGLRFAV